MCTCVYVCVRVSKTQQTHECPLTSAPVRGKCFCFCFICFIKLISRYGCVWRKDFTIKKKLWKSFFFFPHFVTIAWKSVGKCQNSKSADISQGSQSRFYELNSNKNADCLLCQKQKTCSNKRMLFGLNCSVSKLGYERNTAVGLCGVLQMSCRTRKEKGCHSGLLTCFSSLETQTLFSSYLKRKSLSYVWLCDPMDYSSPWYSPDQNTGVVIGIFPTQGLNPGLLHCKWILYQLSHQGSPRILEWVAYLFFSGSSWLRNLTRVSCITSGFFTSWAYQGSPSPVFNYCIFTIHFYFQRHLSFGICA